MSLLGLNSGEEEMVGREELLGELSKFKKLKEMVECPVCLMTPREGPMACCPRGHLICSPFLTGIKGDQVALVIRTGDLVQQIFGEEEEVKIECPTCRGPM